LEVAGWQTMANQLAEVMHWFLKYKQVIQDDPEENGIIISKWKKKKGNRKR
jgi:hypothetical protein